MIIEDNKKTNSGFLALKLNFAKAKPANELTNNEIRVTEIDNIKLFRKKRPSLTCRKRTRYCVKEKCTGRNRGGNVLDSPVGIKEVLSIQIKGSKAGKEMRELHVMPSHADPLLKRFLNRAAFEGNSPS